MIAPPAPVALTLSVAALLLFSAGCGGGESLATGSPVSSAPGAPAATTASFAQIQASVLTTSCATSGCHLGSSPQGQLSLSADVAYEQLVGISPANPAARADGLKRVRPGLPDSSLLYHKLITVAGHHAHDYGNPMPSGTAGLSVGVVEYIRQWIAAGAPKTGVVADGSLLIDRTPQAVMPFQPLVAPLAGSGIQLKVDRFDVVHDFERELFTYRKVGNADPLYVSRIQTSMRPLSHHFVLYTFSDAMPSLLVPAANTVRDIRNPDGSMNFGNMLSMGYHVFFAGSMSQQSDYSFPEGMALRLPADAALDLNVHYANHTSATVPGEAYVNLYTVPASQVTRALSTLNLSNMSFTLPAAARTTVEKSFTFSRTTTIVALTSHMHARGERYRIQIVGGARDGEFVYENTDWEHPSIVNYQQPIVLQAGQGLRSVVTYNNTTAKAISFGLTSEEEMDIIFGYFY